MVEFLDAAFRLPTAVFTGCLILVVTYWLLVILGATDLDVLDVDAEVDLDGVGGLATLLNALGVVGVPITVTLSVLVLVAWAATFTGTELLGRGGLGLLEGVWLIVAVPALACLLALVVTPFAVRPLARFFDTPQAMRTRDLVGRTGVLRTGRVDKAFGQVEVTDDEGGTVLLDVRCNQVNELTRGAEVVLYDYDAKRNVFLVAPPSGSYASFLDVSRADPPKPDS